jgi:hypothetical protein
MLKNRLQFNWLLTLVLLAGMVSVQAEQVSESAVTAQPQIAAPADDSGLVIGSIYVDMDPEDAWLLNNKPSSDKSSFPLRVRYDNEKHNGRIAVSGSSTRRFIKKSLRITLADGNWLGTNKITLNAMASDSTMMRVWLAWELARAVGLPAPVTQFVRLYVNNNYAGLYLAMEWVRPEVFARAGYGNEGQFYQPNDDMYCGDLMPQSLITESPITGNRCWSDLSANKSMAPLEALIKGIDATPTDKFDTFVSENFADESVINWILVNGLIGNSDTYNKNYFLYRSKAQQKWVVMPWDFDLSFGRNWDPFLASPMDIHNDNFSYYNAFDNGAVNPLKGKLLNNPAGLKRVRDKFRHYLGIGKPLAGLSGYGWFSPEQMAARIDQIKSVIEIDAKNDPYSNNRYAEFLEDVEALKYFVLARRAYLSTNVASEGVWLYYNDPNWVMPERKPVQLSAISSVKAGTKQVVMVDKLNGLVTAVFDNSTIEHPSLITTVVDGYQAPMQLPADVSAENCLQRSWILSQFNAGARLEADLTLEYHEENQRFQERAPKVANVHNLKLFAMEGGNWRELPTQVNAHSKTLTSHQVAIRPDVSMRLVACEK